MQQAFASVPGRLTKAPSLPVPGYSGFAYENLNLALFSGDAMFEGNDEHYLSVGASALSIIEACRALAGWPGVRSVLDFGAGAGRVTRWLRAAYPDATIVVSDLRGPDIDFCAETFGAIAWPTGTDITGLEPPKVLTSSGQVR